MPTRLEFGCANTLEQALIRLPNREHRFYQLDPVIEHLAHLKERLLEIIEKPNTPREIDDRFVPLATGDMYELQLLLSFRRGIILKTCVWGNINESDLPWSRLIATEDDAYRWWQISLVLPAVKLDTGMRLVCIETNSRYVPSKPNYRFDQDSEFELGFASAREL